MEPYAMSVHHDETSRSDCGLLNVYTLKGTFLAIDRLILGTLSSYLPTLFSCLSEIKCIKTSSKVETH